MRDVYPPRITLDFKLVGADGNVLAQGTRELSDIAYLQRGSLLADSDQLRYEKRLIDDWLRKEFREPASLSRSEEPPSERQSLMRISYAVICWKKKTNNKSQHY